MALGLLGGDRVTVSRISIAQKGGVVQPDQDERLLEQSAAPQSCPNPSTVVYGLDFPYDQAVCQGGRSVNGFFGNGIVDAVAALTGSQRR